MLRKLMYFCEVFLVSMVLTKNKRVPKLTRNTELSNWIILSSFYQLRKKNNDTTNILVSLTCNIWTATKKIIFFILPQLLVLVMELSRDNKHGQMKTFHTLSYLFKTTSFIQFINTLFVFGLVFFLFIF